MSLHIDPKALRGFATDAAGHSSDLKKVNVSLNITADSLGSFEEASGLVKALNAHTAEVNQRLQAASDALWSLANAASLAADLAHASDGDITRQMKKINHQVDTARRKLGPQGT